MESEKLKKFKSKRDKIRQRIVQLEKDVLITSQKADEMLEFIEIIKDNKKTTQ